jgi:hypothetical protein
MAVSGRLVGVDSLCICLIHEFLIRFLPRASPISGFGARCTDLTTTVVGPGFGAPVAIAPEQYPATH